MVVVRPAIKEVWLGLEKAEVVLEEAGLHKCGGVGLDFPETEKVTGRNRKALETETDVSCYQNINYMVKSMCIPDHHTHMCQKA